MPNGAGDADPDDGTWHPNRHRSGNGNVVGGSVYMNGGIASMQMHQGGEQPPQHVGGVYRQNDLYTLYANNVQQMGPGGMPGNFTMLPVGHGGYVQVFHQPETNEQPVYNNYELFAPNSFIPHHVAIQQQQQQQSQANNNPEIPSSGQNHYPSESTTNMFLNRLATNWTPNVSGTYSPFGEQHSHLKSFNHVIDSNPLSQPLPLQTCSETLATASPSVDDSSYLSATAAAIDSPKTNGNLESRKTIPEVRKRMVAAVKPIRMSYSDVLSQNVAIDSRPSTESNSTSNYSSSSETTIAPTGQKNPKPSATEKKSSYDEKKSFTDTSKEKFETKTKKYESQNSSRNDDSSGSSNTNLQKDKRKSNGDENSRENTANNKTSKRSIPPLKTKPKSTVNADTTAKRHSYKRDLDDEVFLASSSTENEKEFYYNVTKTESNFDRQPKTAQYSSPNLSNKKTRLITVSGQKSSFRAEKPTTYYASKRGQKTRKNANYELIVKLAEKWYEYTMKILMWLFYLVYDIIVLGFGMFYDRIENFTDSMCSFFVNLRQDLRNNSGKPGAWLKNLFKKFDVKFKKNSRWAIWRYFTEKKATETTTDFYENGRLPQTGDEAIYSLLNCKGKDAYSILGVTSESSQEQIRKHYKKIAMLVHPDKNKQPGAEEAFKVLQRAFELIGEPENRVTYDKSLAEELDAKKQWSELHDLLSQLQQKIAEAANTIRCSSCGLRHPRKLTERPHYAARECSSCKIRHSAREGDIWTETSIFGLRWRYLALMEGKVYDITEWANCQKGALAYLQPNSHVVQYRIVRGVQEKQQHEKQNKERSKREFGKLLDNIYSGHNPQAQPSTSSRRRSTKRN